MTKGIEKYIFLLFITIVMFSYGCNSGVSFADSVSIPSEEWTLENVPHFEADISDTISLQNIFFTLRTGSSYPFKNIYLFVTTTSPAGKIISDTLQYIIADDKGRWYGKGFGDIHELKLPFKQGVYFPVKGTYSFKIRHGMRTETLKGVYDIGLRIEKIKK
jgi:gliding motility-associated lipoprotein GldH